MKTLSAILVAVLLSTAASSAFQEKAKTKPDPVKGGGDKGTPALSEVQWQAWGPTECMPLHPGALPGYRGKSAKFTYEIRQISSDAPAAVAALQPYYLTPARDNPIVLYAGQELIVQITYTFPDGKEPTGNNKEEALAAARKALDSEIPLITIDISSTQGTAINPAPVRPNQGQTTLSIEGFAKTTIKRMYACAYKKPLIGDTIPAVTVTALTKGQTQPLQLLQTSLPQVHTLSYFNIATGVIGSTIRDTTFSRVLSVAATSKSPAQYKTISQTGDPRVMPALIFTAYLFRPIDAEVPFETWDLFPQPSVGFSLASPSTDFMFGFSSEFFKRNVQLVYGCHYGQITRLVPGQADDPTSSTAPQTIKRFKTGAFVGLTFNIDFIKGLFGGGSGKGP
jgi:hypothetical protein